MVLLPEPVAPTRASDVPAGTSRVTPATAGVVLPGYANVTSSKRRWPRTGRSRRTGSAGSSTSTGRSRYSKMRANRASELVSETPTPSRPISGRNRLSLEAGERDEGADAQRAGGRRRGWR
nr:hypothetical protein GCM10020092_042020 [Actinoplanes digitatis]